MKPAPRKPPADYPQRRPINDIIVARCEKLELSVTDLARLMKVSKGAASRWLSGQWAPDVQSVPLLSEVIKVSEDKLLAAYVRPKAA